MWWDVLSAPSPWLLEPRGLTPVIPEQVKYWGNNLGQYPGESQIARAFQDVSQQRWGGLTCSVSLPRGCPSPPPAPVALTSPWPRLGCSSQFFSLRGSLQGFVLLQGSNQAGPGPGLALCWFSFLDSHSKSSAGTSHAVPVKRAWKRFELIPVPVVHPNPWSFIPAGMRGHSQER